MTAGRPIYEPEVEELLRELAADPTSTLLRVPRKGIVPTLFDRGTMVSPRAAGLSSAERHLLQVYREEVELLLRQAWILYSQQNEPFGPVMSWHVTVDRRHEPPSIEEWRSRSQRALERPLEGDGAPEARELLLQCIRESPLSLPTHTQLAAAALRLVPTNQARIYIATDLQLSGRIEVALRSYRDVLSHSSAFHRSFCLQNMTNAHENLGDLESAALCAAEACSLDESRPDPLMNWLCLSIQRMDREAALRAASRIDELLPVDHAALVAFVQGMPECRALGWWKPQRGVAAFLSGIIERLGPPSRSVAHAFY